MRVLHVIPSLASRYGGPSVVMRPMALALQGSAGIEVEIATTDADGPENRVQPDEVCCGTVPVHVFKCCFSKRWTLSAGLQDWLRKNVCRFDLVHVHTLWNFPTAAACFAAREAGRPYIVRPCGMLSKYTWKRSPIKKHAYWSAIERRNIENAIGLHVTSEGEAADVAALNLHRQLPTFTIPLGIDPAALATKRNAEHLRKLCGMSDDNRPIILFLSRLHPKKGVIDVLVPALARLKSNALLAIVGGVDERTPNHGSEIQDEARRLGIESRVRFLGRVQPDDRWAMFDGADVFVLPSHSENFGNVVIEAMSRALPVVATDAVQGAGHILTAEAGLVVPVDPGSVAAALDTLLADPAGARDAGERGREYIQAHLGWGGVARQIKSMYRACLS